MEIYKLSDEVPEEKREGKGDRGRGFKGASQGDFGLRGQNRGVENEGSASKIAENTKLKGGVFRVTDLKQGVRNSNRVNVFINRKFSFSLDIQQIVDLGVKVGLEVSKDRLAELKKASEFGKAYQRALEWVLVRPRSEREARDYLRRRERKEAERVEYDFDDLIIERLKERGYLDDKKFAEYYVQNRFVNKGISKRRLEMELTKKGISRENIEEVIGFRNEEEEIRKIIEKKRGKYDDEKLIQYLCRQGFQYELVRNLVRSGRD